MSYQVKVNGNVLPESYTADAIRGYAPAWREYRAEVEVALSGTGAFVSLARFLGEPEPPRPPVSGPLPYPYAPPSPPAMFVPPPMQGGPTGELPNPGRGGDARPAGFVAPFARTGFQPTIVPTAPAPLKKNTLAIVSMVLGIIGLAGLPVTCGLSLAISIPATVLGYLSYQKIRRPPREFGGTGFAFAGIITGSIGMVIAPIVLAIAVPNVLAARRSANQASALQAVFNISSSQTAYQLGAGKGNYAGSLEELGSENGLTPNARQLRNRGQLNGYEIVKFEAIPGSKDNPPKFQAIIAPVRRIGIWRTGDLCYFVDETGVVRQSRGTDNLPDEHSLPIRDESFPFDPDNPPPYILPPRED